MTNLQQLLLCARSAAANSTSATHRAIACRDIDRFGEEWTAGLTDQIAYLQGEQKIAQGAAASAEAQQGIAQMLSQKKVELATATTAASVRNSREERQEALNSAKEQVDATVAGSQERIDALQKEYDLAVQLDGKQSSQALSAYKEMTDAKMALAKQNLEALAQLETDSIQSDNETAKEGIANAKSLYESKEISAQQEIALMASVEATRQSGAQWSLDNLKTIWADYPDMMRKVNDEIAANENLHQNNMAAIARTSAQNMAREYAASWNNINRDVLSAESQFTSGVLSGRQTLGSAMVQLAERAAEDEIAADIRYYTERALLEIETGNTTAAKEEGGVLLHVFGESQKTAATETGVTTRATAETTGAAQGKAASASAGSADILNNAYRAASGAYAALAGIPVVGPVLAPIAAGAAFAAVSAFDVMSAERGSWKVAGDGSLYELHKDEMVMPSYLANPMRRAVSNIASGGGGGGGSSGGAAAGRDLHVHVHAMDSESVMGSMKKVKRELTKMVSDTLDSNPSTRPSYR